jgi:anti-sigma factor RsiW
MNEIVCASGVELLMEYLEGVLADDVRQALDAHVAGCARCLAFVAAYRETPRIMREATETEIPADVQRSLQAFLRARRGGPDTKR